MQIPFFKRRDIEKLGNVECLGKQVCYEVHSKDTCKAILNVDEQADTGKYYPHNAEGDRNEPVVADGRDKCISEINRWVFLLQ